MIREAETFCFAFAEVGLHRRALEGYYEGSQRSVFCQFVESCLVLWGGKGVREVSLSFC